MYDTRVPVYDKLAPARFRPYPIFQSSKSWYRHRDNRYVHPLSQSNDIKIDELQGGIEYQRHKVPLRRLAAGLRRLRPIHPHHRKVYASTPCCVLPSRVLRFKCSRTEAVWTWKTWYDPRFLSRSVRWGWARYNHHRVTARNFSRLFMDHRLNFEGDQVARSRVDYGCSLHIRLQSAECLY